MYHILHQIKYMSASQIKDIDSLIEAQKTNSTSEWVHQSLQSYLKQSHSI